MIIFHWGIEVKTFYKKFTEDINEQKKKKNQVSKLFRFKVHNNSIELIFILFFISSNTFLCTVLNILIRFHVLKYNGQ